MLGVIYGRSDGECGDVLRPVATGSVRGRGRRGSRSRRRRPAVGDRGLLLHRWGQPRGDGSGANRAAHRRTRHPAGGGAQPGDHRNGVGDDGQPRPGSTPRRDRSRRAGVDGPDGCPAGVAAHRARRGDHRGPPPAARRVGDLRRPVRDDARRRTRCATAASSAGAGRGARAEVARAGREGCRRCRSRRGGWTDAVRQAVDAAGTPDPFRVSVFTALGIHDDAATARRIMAPFVCGMLDDGGTAVLAHPHIDEILERHRERGVDGIADMPADWWIELGAIGTFDDAVHHAEALVDAGAMDVAFFPGPTVELAREDLASRHPPRRCPPLTRNPRESCGWPAGEAVVHTESRGRPEPG